MEPQAMAMPQTPPIPPTPPSSKTNSSLVLIMSIFLIVTVAIAGLFYFQIQKLSKELSKYQTQPSPTPTVTTDPTANWKTYMSAKYRFQIKYPGNWISCLDQGTGGQFIDVNQQCKPPYATYYLSFNVFENTQEIPVYTGPGDSSAYETQGKQVVRLGSYQFTKQVFKQVKSMSLNGKEYPAGPTVMFYDVIDSVNNRIVEFYKSPTSNLEENTPDQILSTFKFLGSISPSPTTTSKACTLEVKLCPDGSSVGRTGPNCEFPLCSQ